MPPYATLCVILKSLVRHLRTAGMFECVSFIKPIYLIFKGDHNESIDFWRYRLGRTYYCRIFYLGYTRCYYLFPWRKKIVFAG